VAARNYVALRSVKLSTLGADMGDTASWDIKLPTQQSNPDWYGATQLYAEIPSLGLYNAYIGQVELTGLPLGKWQTVSLQIPSNILDKLRGQYTDLVITVVLNVPYDAPGAYLLDNLRFGGSSAVCVVPVAECIVKRQDGEPIQAVFGYRSCLATSNLQIPVGATNQFTPGAADRGQPTQFQAGHHGAQFYVSFDGSPLVWTLGKNEAVASRFLPECTPECVANLFDPSASPATSSTVVASPSPLSRAESLNIRRGFRWSETTPVPEQRADGIPILYHAIVYLANRGDHDLLDAMQIHYDTLPIFGEERDNLRQLSAPYAYDFDGSGQFVFAIIPGTLYNAIRSAALDPTDPDEMFSALQLRDIPALEARANCGLTPVAECVVDQGGGNLTAIFGYNNPANGVVTIPSGPDNLLSSNPTIASKPEVFATGVQQHVLAAHFMTGASVGWTLNGQTVTANANTAKCSASVLSSVGGDRVSVPKHVADVGDFDCRPPTPNEVAYPQSTLPPAARENTCASVNYDYLGKYGFQWRGLDPGEEDVKAEEAQIRVGLLPDATSTSDATTSDATSTHSAIKLQARRLWSLGHFVRSCVKKVAGAIKKTMDLVEQGLEQVARLFVGSREVVIGINLKNTDSDFTPSTGPTDMVQAWGATGAGFGEGLKVKGVSMRAAKYVFLSKGGIGDDNKAKVRVLNHVGADICFTVENAAAELMSGWFIPHEVCDFIPPNGGGYSVPNDGKYEYTVPVQASYMNVIAQLTDGKKYMHDVAGSEMQQSEVIIGTIANWIGAFTNNRGFTPCLALDGGALSVYDLAIAAGSQLGKMPASWVLSELSSSVKTESAAAGKVKTMIQNAVDSMSAVTTELSAKFSGKTVSTAANTAYAASKDANTAADQFVTDMQTLDRAQQAATTSKQAADAAVGQPDEEAKKAAAHAAAQNVQSALTTAQNSGTSAIAKLGTALDRFGDLYTAMAGVAVSQAVTDGVGSAYKNLGDAKGVLQNTAGDFEKVAAKVTEVVSTIVSDVVLFFGVATTLGEVFEFLAAGDIILPEVVPSVCATNPKPPTKSVCPSGKTTKETCPPSSGQCYQDADRAGFPTGIVQDSSDPRYRSNVRGRGVATHEYGHYTLCNLLSASSGEKAFRKAYSEAAIAGLLTPDNPSSEPLYINDGFADFFASEVVGGTSYPTLVSSKPDSPTGGMHYCTDATNSCFEDNIGAPASTYSYNPTSPSYRDEVARILTTLHDVFDRWGVLTFPGTSLPAQVTAWTPAAPDKVVFSSTYEGSKDDEAVSLDGSAWFKIVANMIVDPETNPHITQDNLMKGINTTMKGAGYNWCTRCEVFRRHTPSATCPSAWMDDRPSGMVCEWEDCVSPNTINHSTRQCFPPCPANYRYDPVQQKCVPIIIIK
jgi:hypothetical protein